MNISPENSPENSCSESEEAEIDTIYGDPTYRSKDNHNWNSKRNHGYNFKWQNRNNYHNKDGYQKYQV